VGQHVPWIPSEVGVAQPPFPGVLVSHVLIVALARGPAAKQRVSLAHRARLLTAATAAAAAAAAAATTAAAAAASAASPLPWPRSTGTQRVSSRWATRCIRRRTNKRAARWSEPTTRRSA